MRKCAACLWGRRDVVGISHTNTALTECTCVHAYVIVYNYVFIFYEYYIYIHVYTYISQYLYQTFLDLLNKLCSAYKSKRGHQDQRNDQLLEWCCQQVRGLLCHTSCSYIVTYVHMVNVTPLDTVKWPPCAYWQSLTSKEFSSEIHAASHILPNWIAEVWVIWQAITRENCLQSLQSQQHCNQLQFIK